jgi:beta-lactamase superfamily II metal-dependent hydrolase
MECAGKKYLFTGDANNNVENSRDWEDIDVLKVGHHGSRTSSSKKFLNKVKPEIALISVGEGNTYGHPTDEALKRLQNVGAKIYRTDESGTILLIEKK